MSNQQYRFVARRCPTSHCYPAGGATLPALFERLCLCGFREDYTEYPAIMRRWLLSQSLLQKR